MNHRQTENSRRQSVLEAMRSRQHASRLLQRFPPSVAEKALLAEPATNPVSGNLPPIREAPESIQILVAHCNPLVTAGITSTLANHREFETVVSTAGVHALHTNLPCLLAADVVIADYKAAIRVLAESIAGVPRVLVVTHRDGDADIRHALELGARGYLLLDCGLAELVAALRLVDAGRIALDPSAANRIVGWMKQQTLTRRERDVLRCLTLGLRNKTIAGELGVALGTVKTYVKAVLEKLPATSRTEAVAIALRRGLLRDDCESHRGDNTMGSTRNSIG